MRRLRPSALSLACAAWLGCTARAPAPVRGIELEEPPQPSSSAGQESSSDSALVASGASAGTPARSDDPSDFVYSREPRAGQQKDVPQLPIHIYSSWWTYRGDHLGISAEEAQKRDAKLSRTRAPAGFWDSQTSMEAVSVWTVLCNECHGGRRSLEDAREMPEPAPAWGEGEGLFFGNRKGYDEMFGVIYKGGPVREGGRAQMPTWRGILSTEMIWALLYFLEYQSGGIESRFPPSLYPRPPKVLGAP